MGQYIHHPHCRQPCIKTRHTALSWISGRGRLLAPSVTICELSQLLSATVLCINMSIDVTGQTKRLCSKTQWRLFSLLFISFIHHLWDLILSLLLRGIYPFNHHRSARSILSRNTISGKLASSWFIEGINVWKNTDLVKSTVGLNQRFARKLPCFTRRRYLQPIWTKAKHICSKLPTRLRLSRDQCPSNMSPQFAFPLRTMSSAVRPLIVGACGREQGEETATANVVKATRSSG